MKKLICLLFILTVTATTALTAEFSLVDIYKTPADFEAALRFDGVEKQAAEYSGKLQSPDMLAKAASLFSECNAELEKLYAYSYLSHADNMLDNSANERLNAVRAAAEYVDSILTPLRIELAALNGIELPDNSAMRELAPSLRLPQEIASIVLNTDFNAKTVTRPDGTLSRATYSELARALTGTDKNYRKSVYEAYYSTLRTHRNTLSATMNAHINGRLRQARLSDPRSTHEYQVFSERYQMPPLTGDVLINTVYNTLGIYRRGGELQSARLGVEKYAPYEVEPAAGTEEGRYSYDEARKLVLDALKPLGNDYLEIAERILYSSHINACLKNDKQPGAFCVSAGRDIDPYIHMNFDGSLNSVSTLAHELGHAVHFVLASTQESRYRNPVLITTETAAITNEILLAKYMLKEAGDFEELNCAASSYADLIGSTLYNQTRLFAFERAIYNHVQNGGTLTADKADELWNAISEPFRSGYVDIPGDARGAWSAVPHLYRDFYVANYAFSVAAAETLAERILDGGAKEYIEFLSQGSSKPAYDIFLDVGVDFLDKKAYNDVVKRFDKLYDILSQEKRELNAA
jgi:oligoendopeptidase F